MRSATLSGASTVTGAERLGNITNNSSPAHSEGLNRASRRRGERRKAQRCLHGTSTLPRVAQCGYAALGNMVSVRVGPAGADYGRLLTCGSVWACPVCSARILYERTRDVAAAIQAWEARGGRVGLVTLTVRHKRSDSLKETWALVSKAWARLTSGKAWAGVKGALGLAGWLKTTEVTHGANGWHVHLHVLAFVDGTLSENAFAGASGALVSRWTKSVAALGGSALNGVQDSRLLVNPTMDTAAYLTKNAYDPDDLALELTRGDLKVGAGRSPFEILRGLVETGETGNGANPDWRLWTEYEQASFRKRQQTWSQGFRDLLGLGDERTDEEIAADEENDPDQPESETVLVGWLPLETWREVRRSDHLYYGLLEAAAVGDFAGFCEAHGLDWLPPEDAYRFGFRSVA